MKIMTLQKVVKTIKKMDAETAVNESMLTDLIDHGCIPSYMHGNRTVTEFDAVVLCLNRMLGMEDSDQIPRVRTIRGAVRELKIIHPDIGIGEDQIRTAVGRGWVDTIRIGCRAYLCMQQFEEPYVRRFIDLALTAVERKQTTSDHAAEQVGVLLKKSSGVPMVKRVRHER